MCIYICMYVYIYIYISLSTYIYIYIYICIYIYIYIYTYIHTHIFTHIYDPGSSALVPCIDTCCKLEKGRRAPRKSNIFTLLFIIILFITNLFQLLFECVLKEGFGTRFSLRRPGVNLGLNPRISASYFAANRARAARRRSPAQDPASLCSQPLAPFFLPPFLSLFSAFGTARGLSLRMRQSQSPAPGEYGHYSYSYSYSYYYY